MKREKFEELIGKTGWKRKWNCLGKMRRVAKAQPRLNVPSGLQKFYKGVEWKGFGENLFQKIFKSRNECQKILKIQESNDELDLNMGLSRRAVLIGVFQKPGLKNIEAATISLWKLELRTCKAEKMKPKCICLCTWEKVAWCSRKSHKTAIWGLSPSVAEFLWVSHLTSWHRCIFRLRALDFNRSIALNPGCVLQCLRSFFTVAMPGLYSRSFNTKSLRMRPRLFTC